MATEGRKIREVRKLLGLRQHELAARLGVSQGTVSKWEKNLQKPDFETMLRLASIAGLEDPMGFARHSPGKAVRGVGLASDSFVIGSVSVSRWSEHYKWEEEDWFLVSTPTPEDWQGYSLSGFVIEDDSANFYFQKGSIVFAVSFDANGLKPQDNDLVVFAERDHNGLYRTTVRRFRRRAPATGARLSLESDLAEPDIEINSLFPVDLAQAGGYRGLGLVGVIVAAFNLIAPTRLPPEAPTE